MNPFEYKIGIVGGAGFIGSELAKKLATIYHVKIVDLSAPILKFPKNVEYECCDICDYQSVKKALKDVDIVIHTAIIQIPKINENLKLGYGVNVSGTQNVCRVVDETKRVKGLLLTGSWHTIGERDITGVVEESFGYRPDKVEDRARPYALSKILQECLVRFYDEMSKKIYGIIRIGTVLGEKMPKGTAANIFIEKGLKGSPITPYSHSMNRPMLYVDIRDVCAAFELYIKKILENALNKGNSLDHIVNIMHPEPITIIELAEMIRNSLINLSDGKICPPIQVVNKGKPALFSPDDKNRFSVHLTRAHNLLGIKPPISPRESIEYIIQKKLSITN